MLSPLYLGRWSRNSVVDRVFAIKLGIDAADNGAGHAGGAFPVHYVVLDVLKGAALGFRDEQREKCKENHNSGEQADHTADTYLFDGRGEGEGSQHSSTL